MAQFSGRSPHEVKFSMLDISDGLQHLIPFVVLLTYFCLNKTKLLSCKRRRSSDPSSDKS
jgi:hypothetical protein